jgi:hypothetical protein
VGYSTAIVVQPSSGDTIAWPPSLCMRMTAVTHFPGCERRRSHRVLWGDVPALALLDNTKTGVNAHRYDLDLNPTYHNFAVALRLRRGAGVTGYENSVILSSVRWCIKEGGRQVAPAASSTKVTQS